MLAGSTMSRRKTWRSAVSNLAIVDVVILRAPSRSVRAPIAGVAHHQARSFGQSSRAYPECSSPRARLRPDSCRGQVEQTPIAGQTGLGFAWGLEARDPVR